MKKYILLFVFFLPIGCFWAGEEKPLSGTYEAYLANAKKYCFASDVSWSGAQNTPLITDFDTNEKRSYPTIEWLKTTWFLDSMKAIFSGKTGTNIDIDKYAFIYKTNMSDLYACAVQAAKIRIHRSILSVVPFQWDALVQYKKTLVTQTEAMEKARKKLGCNDFNTDNKDIKQVLLDNVTAENCRYRFFLYYLENTTRTNLSMYLSGAMAPKGQLERQFVNSESALRFVSRYQEAIQTEKEHINEVFPLALAAYAEFEQTYGAHVLFDIIKLDYVTIRQLMKQLLNPISQFVYKAHQAQGPAK